jgi:hypothetical protein
MPSNYPGALDTDVQFPTILPTDTMNSAGKVHSIQHTNMGDAIQAIEAELGISPKSGAGTSFATVKARLDNMEDRLGAAPLFTGPTAPASPVDGMVWLDTSNLA